MLDDEVECSFIPMAAVEAESGGADGSARRQFGELRRKSFRPFREGDVLVAKITPSMENGKAAVAKELTNGVGFGSTEFHVLRPRDGVEPRYVLHYVLQRSFREEAARHMTGTAGQRRVPARYLDESPIPVAPAAEQRRLVAEIEEQLSRLDAALSTLSTAEQRLGVLRRSASASWFRGEWPSRPLAALVDPERPIRYGILMPKQHVADGVLYVRVRDFPVGTILVDGLKRTSEEIANKYRRSSLQPGDVLVSIRGTFGRVALVPPELDGANITQDTARVALVSEVDRNYFVAYVRSEPAQRFFRSVARGVAVRGVNLADLREMPVPLPPRDEQMRIAAAAEGTSTFLDALEVQVKHARRRAALLRRAILERAFRGELVPQDPGDEPAGILLDRIAAERANTEPRPRRRKKTPA
jgi:type I restriction enzyme S subunit